MIRMLSAVAIFVGIFSGVGVPVAGAEPPPPCGFKISPPETMLVEGITVVTTSVSPDVCLAPSGPSQSVACIQLQGGEGGNTCAQSTVTDVAQVYVPYTPGGTYIATGRGVPSWLGQDVAPEWQILGPISATL
jgi:hypothetical protein